MNRLNTFLSISSLSLASSVSVAVAETKEFEHKKADHLPTSFVNSQQTDLKQNDLILSKQTPKK